MATAHGSSGENFLSLPLSQLWRWWKGKLKRVPFWLKFNVYFPTSFNMINCCWEVQPELNPDSKHVGHSSTPFHPIPSQIPVPSNFSLFFLGRKWKNGARHGDGTCHILPPFFPAPSFKTELHAHYNIALGLNWIDTWAWWWWWWWCFWCLNKFSDFYAIPSSSSSSSFSSDSCSGCMILMYIPAQLFQPYF